MPSSDARGVYTSVLCHHPPVQLAAKPDPAAAVAVHVVGPCQRCCGSSTCRGAQFDVGILTCRGAPVPSACQPRPHPRRRHSLGSSCSQARSDPTRCRLFLFRKFSPVTTTDHHQPSPASTEHTQWREGRGGGGGGGGGRACSSLTSITTSSKGWAEGVRTVSSSGLPTTAVVLDTAATAGHGGSHPPPTVTMSESVGRSMAK